MQEQIERQRIMLDNRDISEEYTRLTILFGYIVMFSSLYPVVTLAVWIFLVVTIYCIILIFTCLIWNLVDIQSYATIYKREQAQDVVGIGLWKNILFVTISNISISNPHKRCKVFSPAL